MSHPFCGRVAAWIARLRPGLAVLAGLGFATPLVAQRVVSQAERVISVSRGASALFISPVPLQRFSVGDPGIAEVTIVSPTEVVINGRSLGSTTLLIWDNSADVKVYSVEVTADAPALERYLRSLLPNEEITVTASGSSITLSGTVKDPTSAQRAVDIARSSGATIIDNLVTPPAVQVKLAVRFAEINRTAFKDWASNLSTLNPHKLSDNGDWSGSTSADGTIQFLLDNDIANFQAFIQASEQRGDFRSLAEPNLMVLPGREAYFLAGGRFPYPAVQGGGASNAIGIQFEEFGVKLRFTPVITRSGSIRLKVEPEVSSLDFANGLVISGFVIPSILSRKATTEVELREGQYLAIAGLLDNATTDNVSKIPVLGDIPILGELFRSKNLQQRRTELLVVVTPRIVTAADQPTPLPTGETDQWNWQRPLQRPAPGTPAADSAAGTRTRQ
ncbi:MAG TPA: pilus assembly protein N-terminal domain-containing protein [Gemmatimonadales bacterium]|nr:pilus assembly protein N-terminal domain-containing protein [Gemmatimonadales bacterium]